MLEETENQTNQVAKSCGFDHSPESGVRSHKIRVSKKQEPIGDYAEKTEEYASPGIHNDSFLIAQTALILRREVK